MLLCIIGARSGDANKEEERDPFEENMAMEEEKNSQEVNLEKMGEFDEDGKFKIRQRDQRKVGVHFKNLYINRVQYIGQQKKFSKVYVDTSTKLQNKPQISQRSQELAMKNRKKRLGDNVDTI